MQGGAAHELHVVVALADDPLGGLAAHGEGLEQEVVEVLAALEALAELRRLGLELGVAELLELGLERADVGHQALRGP